MTYRAIASDFAQSRFRMYCLVRTVAELLKGFPTKAASFLKEPLNLSVTRKRQALTSGAKVYFRRLDLFCFHTIVAPDRRIEAQKA
jgi:hypothetical protein